MVSEVTHSFVGCLKQAEGPSDSYQECGDATLGGLDSRRSLDSFDGKRFFEIALDDKWKLRWDFATGHIMGQSKNS